MKNKRTPNRLEKLIMRCVRSEIKPHWASLWGQREYIHPAFCEIIHGNGRQVVWLKTGDSRPNYYVLRIDSSVDMDSEDFDPEILLTRIEEQFGNVDDFEQKEFDGQYKYRRYYAHNDDHRLPYEATTFPVLSTGNGYWWGNVQKF